jgi:4'-phosphopantetheinyl transferase
MTGAAPIADARLARMGFPEPGLQVFTCPLDTDESISLGTARALLTGGEQTRTDRFHFARDRDRYTRGRGFLRMVLGGLTGTDPVALELTTGPHGKPGLKGPLHFNLSHSAGRAVLAVSDAGPVGIDIEHLDRRVDVPALGQVCFTPAENARLRAAPGADQARLFFAYWTAKEARMKLTGQGMSLPPRAIALALDGSGLPAGYLAPATPSARLVRLTLPDPALICSLALSAQNMVPL